jgi:hypothetical protein
MTGLPLRASALPLLAGIVAATALSGAAVFTVLRSGCDNPGVYRFHGDAVELVGGCLDRSDLPTMPERTDAHPLGIGRPVEPAP